MLPNMEERPKLRSMTKNSTAHTCEPGIDITASVKTIKARPVPDALWGSRIKDRQEKHESTGTWFTALRKRNGRREQKTTKI